MSLSIAIFFGVVLLTCFIVIGFMTKWKFGIHKSKCSTKTCDCCNMPRENRGQLLSQPNNWICSTSQDGYIVRDSSKGWIQIDFKQLQKKLKDFNFDHDIAFTCLYNGMKSQNDSWDKCKKQHWPNLSKPPANLCWRAWYNINDASSTDHKNTTPTIFEYAACNTTSDLNVLLPKPPHNEIVTEFMTWWHGVDSPYVK